MTVIRLDNVSKAYDLHAGRKPFFQALGSMLGSKNTDGLFYALKDVSFEVHKGETLGIVGRNGSGKSTMLKIISGITNPTKGNVTVDGRVMSMIELGAGFHPDLTGRENIFMNGALLGLKREFIQSKFDEIVEFAELHDFIDISVKKYSSGMYARLGFAVSSIVEPDILIIDEVLAVGDEGFQRKCYAKIENLRKEGVSIILVSHSASAIIELCNRAILLDEGKVILDGRPKFVISKYHQLLFSRPEARTKLREYLVSIRNSEDAANPGVKISRDDANERKQELDSRESFDEGLIPKSKFSYADRSYYGVKIRNPMIVTAAGKKINNLILGRTYSYIYEVDFDEPAFNVRFGMLIKTITGYELGGGVTNHIDEAIPIVERGSIAQLRFDFKCLLRPGGVYFMNAGVVGAVDGAEVFLDRIIDAYAFRVFPEKDLIGGGVVSFQVESNISIVKRT